MKKLPLILIFAIASANTIAQTELKSVSSVGGSILVHNVSSPTDSCSYSISVAGEMASSGMFTAGIFSGNIGFIHPDEDTLQVKCVDDGVNELLGNNDQITVFPNPNTGSFTFQVISNTKREGEVRLLDMLGRTYALHSIKMTAGTNRYSFKGIPPGVYFVVFVDKVDKAVLKVVVE